MHLPLDYPRINQFPEWFTVAEGDRLAVREEGGREQRVDGSALRTGLPLELAAGQERRLRVTLRR